MFKFIINFYVLILLFKLTIAQIHLTKENLNQVCRCNSSQSISINLILKKITSIDSSTFNGLNSLQDLTLYNNQLTTIHPSTFNGLNSLQDLDLQYNQLKTIHPSTFNGLNSLQRIYLTYNQLTTLDPFTFTDSS